MTKEIDFANVAGTKELTQKEINTMLIDVVNQVQFIALVVSDLLEIIKHKYPFDKELANEAIAELRKIGKGE